MANPKLKYFYNSQAWKKLASKIRKQKFYTCEKCGAINSKEVHHIKPITELNVTDPNITLNESNLMLLCNECHNEIHNRFKKSKSAIANRSISFDSHGNVIDINDDTTSKT